MLVDMHYLLKTEPSVYSFADLKRDKTTIWDGVTYNASVWNLSHMQPGAKLIIYHTGNSTRAVGTATVVSVDANDPKSPRVKIKAGKPLARTITLKEIKTSPLFKNSQLARQGRLSVVPITEQQYEFIVG